MSKVALASIRSLTFYDDALTTARRTDPIPQLNCVGKACSLYTPEVVRCANVGGHGTDVDWKVRLGNIVTIRLLLVSLPPQYAFSSEIPCSAKQISPKLCDSAEWKCRVKAGLDPTTRLYSKVRTVLFFGHYRQSL